MAMMQTLIEDSEATHPSLRAFLHQRTRQWRYTDLSTNPAQCIELPDDYVANATVPHQSKVAQIVRWNEELPQPRTLSEITKAFHRLTVSIAPNDGDKSTSTDSTTDISSDWGSASVPCPTFAGGKEPTGECIFTEPAVQHAVLSFFEEVAQDPENYDNPPFTTLADIPHPTADAPFSLNADSIMHNTANSQIARPVLSPEQAELEDARAKLADMRIALDACPDVDALAKARAKLAEKIVKQEAAIDNLQVKALGSGSLGAGEADDLRKDWSPKVDGPRVPFAGTMVDSELLKAAGLGETAEEELEKIDEEKAFL